MTSRVGPKGQVVIPKTMRDQLGIRPGDQVDFELEPDAVRVQRVTAATTLRGRFAGLRLTDALVAEHEKEQNR